MPPQPHLVEVLEDGVLDDLAVDGSHAVDAVAGHNREVRHAHALGAARLLNDTHAADALPVVTKLGAELSMESGVSGCGRGWLRGALNSVRTPQRTKPVRETKQQLL
jgi:hypothetical protein